MNHDAQHKVLGIVPARGGSKGIERKNIRMLGGKPLLAYTAAAARNSATLSRVLLSTDDPEIAEAGKAFGLEVSFLRPAKLAEDATPMIEVILHALRWVESHGERYDAVCLLQPTSPLRTPQTIDRCVASLWQHDVETVVSVRPVPAEYNPHWVFFETSGGLLQPSMGDGEPIPSRQLLPAAYHRDGSVFAARTETVMTRESLYGAKVLGVVSPEAEAADLDTEEQWQAVERRLNSAHDVVAEGSTFRRAL